MSTLKVINLCPFLSTSLFSFWLRFGWWKVDCNGKYESSRQRESERCPSKGSSFDQGMGPSNCQRKRQGESIKVTTWCDCGECKGNESQAKQSQKILSFNDSSFHELQSNRAQCQRTVEAVQEHFTDRFIATASYIRRRRQFIFGK